MTSRTRSFSLNLTNLTSRTRSFSLKSTNLTSLTAVESSETDVAKVRENKKEQVRILSPLFPRPVRSRGAPRRCEREGKWETTKPRLLKLSLNLEFLLNSFKNWVAKRSSDRASLPVWGLRWDEIKRDYLRAQAKKSIIYIIVDDIVDDGVIVEPLLRLLREKTTLKSIARARDALRRSPSSAEAETSSSLSSTTCGERKRSRSTMESRPSRDSSIPSPAPQVVLCSWLSHWTLCVRNDWSQKGRRRRRSTISPAAPSTLTSRAASMSWLLCLSFSHAYPNPIVRVQRSTCDSRRICRRYFLLASCKHWLHFEAPRFVLFWKLFCSKFYSQN